MRNEGDLSTDDLARPGGAAREGQPAGGAEVPPADAGERQAGVREGGSPPPMDDPAGGGETARMSSEQDQLPSEPTGATRRTVGADSIGDPNVAQDDGAARQSGDVALLDTADEERFRQRWSDVQARFVDDPQEAVRTADGLVAELMQTLAQAFSGHKGRLESEWQRGGDPDTEELRLALQRYRSFFDRLLST